MVCHSTLPVKKQERVKAASDAGFYFLKPSSNGTGFQPVLDCDWSGGADVCNSSPDFTPMSFGRCSLLSV